MTQNKKIPSKDQNLKKNNTVPSKNKVKPAVPMISEGALKYFRVILLVCISVVLMYPPFLRGLYFEREQLPTEVYIFLVFTAFWVYKWIKRDRRFLETPVDYASFSLTIVYFISIFSAVGTRSAVLEWFKYAMYFVVFFMLSELAATYSTKLTMLWVIMASAAGVCILGIDGAAGEHIAGFFNRFFDKNDPLFFGTFVDGRIFSTLQYPNALASYLMAVYFVVLGLLIASSKLWSKMVASALGFLFLFTFVFTISRGAFIMFPVFCLILLFVLPKGAKVKAVVYTVAMVIPTGLASMKFQGYTTNPQQNAVKIWEMVAIGLVAAVVLVIAAGYIAKALEKVSWKVYAGIVAGLAVLTVAGLIMALNIGTPLQLEHPSGQKDSSVTVQKSSILQPGKSYKLLFSVSANADTEKPYAYDVNVVSRSEKDILLDKWPQIADITGKATKGTEEKEIDFKVPDDSRIININFTNTYEGTKAVFDQARIVDAATGRVEKKLILKYKYIPNSISARFEDILATKSGVQRALFYKDGLKIFKDYWFIGAGGGSWPLLYFSYQSYLYFTTQAHNYFLQIAVESGTIGVLALLFLMVSLLAVFIVEMLRKKEKSFEEYTIQMVLFVGIASMIAHSAIDFDLSLSAVFLLLWELIALFNSDGKANRNINKGEDALESEGTGDEAALEMQDKNGKWYVKLASGIANLTSNMKKTRVKPAYLIVCTLIAAIIPSLYILASAYSDSAAKATNSNDYTHALEDIRSAARMDPFNTDYKARFANLLIINGKTTPSDLQAANSEIGKLEKLVKYDSEGSAKVAQLYLYTGEFEKGLEYIDRAVKLRPFVPAAWQQKVSADYEIMQYYFDKKDLKNALKYMDKAMSVVEEARNVNKNNLDPFVFTPTSNEMLETIKYIKERLNTEKRIDAAKVAFYSPVDIDVNLDGIPDQWTAPDSPGVKISSRSNILSIDNTQQGKLEFIRSRIINLKPGQNYTVELELGNTPVLGEIPFAFSDISSSSGQLKLKGNIFTADVSVPQDYKSQNNALLLGVLGKYEIKNIKVMQK